MRRWHVGVLCALTAAMAAFVGVGVEQQRADKRLRQYLAIGVAGVLSQDLEVLARLELADPEAAKTLLRDRTLLQAQNLVHSGITNVSVTRALGLAGSYWRLDLHDGERPTDLLEELPAADESTCSPALAALLFDKGVN